MNYRPDVHKLHLWDTWIYPDPKTGLAHLFFLANRPDENWEWVGHVVSDDLVTWNECEPIHVRRPGDEYDVGCIGTGMVFEGIGDEYVMSYTAHLDGKQQAIAFLHSNDLYTWHKRLPKPCIYPEPRYYENDNTKAPSGSAAFRDAFIHQVNGRLEALIGAQSTQGNELARGVIARYVCDGDDLTKWRALPALLGPNIKELMEVPEHFIIGNKHYLIWSTYSFFGFICDTPTRHFTAGTYYAVSDTYDGTYTVPADNLLIGTADNLLKKNGALNLQSYVGRTFLWKGERLLYHHMAWPAPSLAFPKTILQEDDGRIKAGYWQGVEKLHTAEISLPLSETEIQGDHIHIGTWQAYGSSGLKGFIEQASSITLVKKLKLKDFHLRCSFTSNGASRVGISLRDNGTGSTDLGVGIQADFRHGYWQFGKAMHKWCGYIEPVETVFIAPLLHKQYQVDLFVRDIYFEAYVDGQWMFSSIINESAGEGSVGFMVESGAAIFENIKVWELPPMGNGLC